MLLSFHQVLWFNLTSRTYLTVLHASSILFWTIHHVAMPLRIFQELGGYGGWLSENEVGHRAQSQCQHFVLWQLSTVVFLKCFFFDNTIILLLFWTIYYISLSYVRFKRQAMVGFQNFNFRSIWTRFLVQFELGKKRPVQAFTIHDRSRRIFG